MKRTTLISVLMLFICAALAQSPSLDFRFNNMGVVNEGSTQYFQFDVEVRASEAGTYHRDMQIYFDYNPAVFGESIKLNNKVSIEKIGVMTGEIAPGTPKYKWVNEGTAQNYGTDNTPTRYYITSEPSLISTPSSSFHNLMPVDWAGYMRVKIEVLAPGPAGIKFIDKLGDVDMMDGGQYYFDPATGGPVVYAYPYGYINNLLDYMVGEESVITEVPFTTSFGVADNWDLITAAGAYGEKAYEEGGWYFHSTAAYRGGTDESFGGSSYSFRDRGIFTVTNLGEFENPMTGFSFQLRDWMLSTGVNRPIEYSFDGGTSWTTALVLNKAWFFQYNVFQAFIYYFPGGAQDLAAGEFLIRISGGDGTNNSRINIGQFKAFDAPPVYYTLSLDVSPEGSGTVIGADQYFAEETILVVATANPGYEFVNWTKGGVEVSTNESFAYIMPAEDVTLVANFQQKFMLTLLASPEGTGTVSGAGEYFAGESVPISASPLEGYFFVNWTLDGAEVSDLAAFNYLMPAMNVTLVANFEQIPADQYELTLLVNPAGYGTVAGGGLYEEGESVPVSATANGGYLFVNWTLGVGGMVVSEMASFDYIMPAMDVTLVANFEEAPIITQVPFTTDFGVADNWDLISTAGSYGEKAYEEGGWYFHSTAAYRGGTDEGFGGSSYSFRDRGIFTVTNLGEFENPMTGFSFQLRDWMASSAANRPIEYSFDGGNTWTTAFVINKAWFAAYQVYQEFVFFFPEGAQDLPAGDMKIRIAGGNNTNDYRINIGQFKALSNTPVFYNLTLNVSPEGAGAVTGGGSYYVGQSVPVTATANDCYQFIEWTLGTDIVKAVPNFTWLMPATDVSLTANFELLSYTIAASAGTGGSITPMGDVIVNCGANQTFNITADSGYEIEDVLVDGASVGAVPTYTFENVRAPHTIQASFALIPTYTLTLNVSPAGAGVVTGAGTYEEGVYVPLTATANACYSFVNWTDGAQVVSIVPNFNYLMPADNVTLTANFLLNTHTITASAGAGGSITPSGAVTVNCGADQAFNISANVGYGIQDVLVDGTSVGAVTTYTFINVTANHTIHATFYALPPDTYTLTLAVNPMGAGTVTGGGTHEAGASVPLTATAIDCYAFVNWTKGAEVVSEVPNFNYVMPEQDVTLTANFQLLTYTITASAGTGGSIAPMGNVVVNCGSNQAFIITADPGYLIADVLVDGTSIGATSGHTFENVTANHTIHATFSMLPPDTYTLTLVPNPMGGGTVTGGGSYEAGTSVPLTATANACYAFVNWTKGAEVVSEVPNFNYVMPEQDVNLTANFQLLTYTITASASTGGSIAPMGEVIVICNEYEYFAITPDPGYVIEDVMVDGESVGAVTNYTFENVTTNHTIHATFAMLPPDTYTLTLAVNPMGAGVVTGGGSFEAGTSVPLTATANACYAFVNWTKGAEVVSEVPNFNYVMPEQAVTLTANFQLLTYTITASAGTGGSIAPMGEVIVNCGANQTFIITPAAGYLIADVLVDGTSIGATSSHTFENVTANHTIHAAFSEIPPMEYTLTINTVGMGNVEVNSVAYTEPITVLEGTVLNLEAIADMGWEFQGWSGDLVSANATASVTMNGNKMITATFVEEVMMYTLTLEVDPMGAGTVSGDGQYEAGTLVDIYAWANMGYLFLNWTMNGEVISSMATYAYLMPEMDVTLVANFEEITDEVYCAYSQGYWFAKPGVVWPNDVTVGGWTFTQEQAKTLFWPASNNTKRAFTQYAAIYLSGTTVSLFPELQSKMMIIEDYFANHYPALANKLVNSAAGFIGDWIDENQCYENYQGIAIIDLVSPDSEEVVDNGKIDSKAYPNPFKNATTIEFMVQDYGNVTLEVFNMVGERIKVLFEGEVKAFEINMVTFDSKDLKPGFFFYTIRAGQEIYVGRLIMIK